MDADCLKLTTYFGERDRAGGRFLSDALVDVFEREGVAVSATFRAIAGFGIRHRLQDARLLTLSEDLPLVTVAVDARQRIEALLPDVAAIFGDGLITLERARLLVGPDGPALPAGEAKLTVYVGRQERAAGRPAYEAVVGLLHRAGVAGATVLTGVDGTVRGARERAAFFASNAQVPLMIVSVGDAERIAAVLPELRALLARPLMTLERVRVCKRDGRLLAAPDAPAATDASGLGVWQKLMVYASEQARHGDHPLHLALVRRLRQAGAAGATALRGSWGYHGDHAPHGDRFWAIRRRVPVVTVIVDTPENAGRWFAIVDELTDETGLVTSETVPALRASGPEIEHGGLRLARP